MRISDWSSDVCSSDLLSHNVEAEHAVDDSALHAPEQQFSGEVAGPTDDYGADQFEAETHEIPEVVRQQESLIERVAAVARKVEARPAAKQEKAPRALRRSAERRLGKGGGSKGRTRGYDDSI